MKTRVLVTVAVLAGAGVAGSALIRGGHDPVGGSPVVPPPTATALPADPHVHVSDPDAVCVAFAHALYQRDTVTDTGPSDTYRRAAAYAEPTLAVALLATVAPRGPGWEQLAAHRGRVAVTVEPFVGEPPPDGEHVAYRAAVVNITVAGRDGWRGEPTRHIVYCTLRAVGPQWWVAEYELG